jgi:RNAse (barnase) inhibitor barstar
MNIITLDGSQWRSYEDFYRALFAALGAPDWHGDNVNALVDSMIWGGINKLEPPYTVRVTGVQSMPNEARNEVELARQALSAGRQDFRNRKGRDIEVSFETYP